MENKDIEPRHMPVFKSSIKKTRTPTSAQPTSKRTASVELNSMQSLTCILQGTRLRLSIRNRYRRTCGTSLGSRAKYSDTNRGGIKMFWTGIIIGLMVGNVFGFLIGGLMAKSDNDQ